MISRVQFRRPSRTGALSLTSVTRWLLVVVGCTGLELVQPALAFSGEVAEAPASLTGDTVLYPTRDDSRPLAPGGGSGSGSTGWLVAGLVLAGAGAWLWLQRRRLGAPGGRTLIGIEETRSLGNRQFLVVASCEGRRLLLGVSPGRIATLAELDDQNGYEAAVPPSPSR